MGEAIEMREPVLRWIAHQMRRLFAAVKLLGSGEQKSAHGDDRLVADAEMFFSAVENRAHAFGGAAIVI